MWLAQRNHWIYGKGIMDRFGVWDLVLMERSALVEARMGQSSCGNSARAVTACGKIKETSLDELHACI